MEKTEPRGPTSEFTEPASSFVNVNGVRMHALDWGGAGAPIVILHATGFLGRIYRPLAEPLRAIGHVYSYDQRGHGDSSAPPGGDYSWDSTMRDLEGFITAMGWSGVLAVGHSAGATAIGALACERPDLISRAVLVEPVIFESPTAPELGWRNPFIERTLRRRRIFDSVEAMYSSFRDKPPYNTWQEQILRDYCRFGTRPASDGRRELKCAPEVEAKFYETSRDFDGLGRILRCTAPLLIMFGARGDSLGAALSAKVAAELKHGRVIDVAGAGHFMPMEMPGYVADRAAEFLASVQ
jgi:pimeloyl-ACP methyl ester carboxylesterase